MNENVNNVILTGYIDIPLDRYDEIMKVLAESGISLQLVTHKDFFDAMMFKQQSPQA